MFEKYKLDEIKDVLDFARHTNRMSYLERYNTTPHLSSEKVDSHSFQVAIVSLCLFEKYKKTFKLNLTNILLQSLCHDLAESMDYVGDISHPIKENNKVLKKALENMEYQAIKELVGDNYVNYLKEFNEGKTIEAMLVNLSDTISCLIYSESEIMKGNKYMERVKYESEERILKLLEKLNARKL